MTSLQMYCKILNRAMNMRQSHTVWFQSIRRSRITEGTCRSLALVTGHGEVLTKGLNVTLEASQWKTDRDRSGKAVKIRDRSIISELLEAQIEVYRGLSRHLTGFLGPILTGTELLVLQAPRTQIVSRSHIRIWNSDHPSRVFAAYVVEHIRNRIY